MTQLAIGVDLGGTTIEAGLVDRDRGIVQRARDDSGAAEGPARILDRIAALVEELRAGVDDLVGVGIGSPGVISLDQRRVTSPPNFSGWGVVDVGSAIHERTGLSTWIDNDANLAGLGSAFFGAGRPFDSFIMATLGTGVGSAIIIDKQIFRGAHGGAGELGHVSIDYEGRYARSGIAGAVEAYVGQEFLTQHARERLRYRDTLLREMTGPAFDNLTPKILHEAALQGDTAAIEILAWAGHKLGCALGGAVSLLDIRTIIVGGGVSGAGDFILDPARKALERFVLRSMSDGLQILQETLGNEAAVLGAARLAFELAGEA